MDYYDGILDDDEATASFISCAGLDFPTVQNLTHSWRSVSNFSTQEMLAYARGYFYVQCVAELRDNVRNVTRILFNMAGFIGYVIALNVLRNSEFKTISFKYHKAICLLELFDMLQGIERGLVEGLVSKMLLGKTSSEIRWNKSLAWFHLLWIHTFGEPQSMSSDTITLFMSFERCLALWLPTKFYLINNSRFAGLVITVSVACGSLYLANYLNIFVNNEGIPYYDYDYDSTFFMFRDRLQIFRSFATVALALFVVAGLIRTNKRRFSRTNSTNAVRRLQQWKTSHQLCLLSLSCSLPLALQATCDYILVHHLSVYAFGVDAVQLPFDVAMQHLRTAEIGAYFKMLTSLAYQLAHCTHFYAYYLLSERFRHATKELLSASKKSKAESPKTKSKRSTPLLMQQHKPDADIIRNPVTVIRTTNGAAPVITTRLPLKLRTVELKDSESLL